MDVRLLVLHRRERYAGEYAPEVVAVCDEYTLEENPEWWTEEIDRQRKAQGADVNAWAEITLDVDSDELLKALYPAPAKLAVSVQETRALPA